MAETNGAGAAGAAPQINTLAQYAKDLSFENPNAPRSLTPQERGPNISVQVNVNAQQLANPTSRFSSSSRVPLATAPKRCSSSNWNIVACSNS